MDKKIRNILLLTLVVVVALTLVACGGSQPNPHPPYSDLMTAKMENYTHLNERALHHQAVMIGDSIVEFYNTFEHYTDTEKIVYNRGIRSDSSDKMLERMVDNALVIEPDTLFILIGTNDIARGVPEDEVFDNIKKAVLLAKEKGVPHIVLESIYPINLTASSRTPKDRNEVTKRFNARLEELARAEGIQYADVFTPLADESGEMRAEYTADGVHPNEAGYDVVTSVLREYLD